MSASVRSILYFSRILLLAHLLSLLPTALCQISVVNGQRVFSGTAVETAPGGAPTLVYNCNKVPALCENVNRRNPLHRRADGGLGALQNGQIQLHFDTNEGRKDDRRRVACPNSWRRNHVCPETNPKQPNTVPRGSVLEEGYPPRAYNRQGLRIGDTGWNRIADDAGGDAGMIWSCDEWPMASTLEGGTGARSYCAPISSRCLATGVYRRSEQNFQSDAQSALRIRAAVGNTPNGIYAFWFKTEWQTDAEAGATSVHYYDDFGAGFIGVYQRRDVDLDQSDANPPPLYHVTENFYDNGTSSTDIRLLSVEETHLYRRQLEQATEEAPPSTHQQFEILEEPPLLPVIDIARDFIAAQAGRQDEHSGYLARALSASNVSDDVSEATLRKLESPDTTTNSRRRAIVGATLTDENDLSNLDFTLNDLPDLDRRQSMPRQCDRSTPCPDGSCCNRQGRCGFGEENCGDDNCVSNCGATALCGRDSKGGDVICPLNVCCSWYGYCGVEEDFCNGSGPDAPCQEGFGSCQTVPAPSCGGSSANGRTIGYYQVANVRDRQCNRIRPDQIDTDGLTHLYLAFASINPSTFQVVPMHSDDPPLYEEFTALKKDGLETWIAIGGWDFNDPGPTRTTFSDLARTPQRRARFINSVRSFMEEYGFQGVDLDWEYPGAPDRGGVDEDTDNYVSLVREMHESFGSEYGISLAIPSSYWYLRWFKPKEMELYVDYFGVMTYDLHGPWDANVRQIGKVILGHTNVPEIANWTQPLWYDDVDPGKINMGLAYYARGYTVDDPNCNEVGCTWSTTSRPGPCTNFGGVMSLQEIEDQVIPSLGVQPQLLKEDMMMQLSWGNQWVGYDNMDTIVMKRQWASSRCFGGTMIWSIDYYSGSGSGDIPDGGGSPDPGNPGGGQDGGGSGVVYIDGEIYDEDSPEVNCYPPCTMILPPRILDDPTIINFPPYVTSLDVAWSEDGEWTSTVQTTTLTIPAVTTTAIEVWAHTVHETRTDEDLWYSFGITPSIRPSPFTITNDPNPEDEPGVSHPPVTRAITPPPWPYTYTPVDSSRPTQTDDDDDDNDDDNDDIIAWFPTPTWKPGSPGPLCTSNCGRNCLIFCDRPCLLDCSDGGYDFPDPENPNPPPKPDPTRPPDPPTTRIPSTIPRPPNPDGDDPQDEEQEEEDQKCALEFDLPIPTYRPPAPSSTSEAPDPPSPKPDPPEEHPEPDPDTEERSCYNGGALVTRAMAIDAIEDFCSDLDGTVLDATRSGTKRTYDNGDGFGAHCAGFLGCFVDIEISVTVKNSCKFTMDGGGANDECGRILRVIIDECNTESTEHKQGGTLKSNCADWRLDPNIRPPAG